MEINLPVNTKASWPSFLQYFIRKQSFATLRKLAEEGQLPRLGIRLNSWRVFLGLFPESGNENSWSESLRISRERYTTLKKSFQITDPLLGDQKFTKLNADVARDMNRTFQNHSFFTLNKVKQEIISVLSIWAATNELGYLQGMSEIASIIYLQVFSEKYNEQDNALKWFNSEEWVEADTFEIFNRLFEVGLQDMYMREIKERPKHAFLGLFQELNSGYSQEDIKSNPVIKVCHDVYEVYLPLIDRGLFEYLRKNNIESHLFLLRWFRCLFSREFNINDTLLLWDFIFSYSSINLFQTHNSRILDFNPQKELSMIKFVSLSFILFIREQLTSDPSQILTRFTNYPPVDDISRIINLALQCKDFLATSNPKNCPLYPGGNLVNFLTLQDTKNQKDSDQKNLKNSIFEKFKQKKKEPETNLLSLAPEPPKNVKFLSADSRLVLIDSIISNISEQISKHSFNKEKLSEAINQVKNLKFQLS